MIIKIIEKILSLDGNQPISDTSGAKADVSHKLIPVALGPHVVGRLHLEEHIVRLRVLPGVQFERRLLLQSGHDHGEHKGEANKHSG